MHSPRIIIIMLLAASALLAPAPSSAQCEEPGPAITGVWEWASTYNGATGETSTPATEGYTLQYEFLDTGSVNIYSDERFQIRRVYVIACDSTRFWGWDWVVRGGVLTQADARVSISDAAPRVLTFEEDCSDCYVFTYVERGPIVADAPTTWGAIKMIFD